MRRLKKVLAALLAGAMVLATAAPAMAEPTTNENKFTITVPEDDAHAYEVYQIFTGTYSEEKEEDKDIKTLSDIKWGQNALIPTETDKDKKVGDSVSEAVLTELKDTAGNDAAVLKVITKYVNFDSTTTTIQTVDNQTALTVPAGYYLIKDDENFKPGGSETASTYVVRVVDNITIARKDGTVTSEKKVKDVNDSTGELTGWQDSADYDIGDMVDFQLTATVPENYDGYKKFALTFHDSYTEGLTFDVDSVKVYVDNGATTSTEPIGTDLYEVVTELEEKHSHKDGDNFKGGMFDIRFSNLKAIKDVKAGSTIRVEYQATLNEGAVIGSAGNPNTMYLEFDNNPNDEGKGETPKDTVIVFTYKTIVNKVKENTEALAGAEFTLEKKIKTGNGTDDFKWVAIEKVAYDGAEGTQTTFEFAGLDDGNYRLTETKTPVGYNTIDPIEFTVTAKHDEEAETPALKELNGKSTTEGQITFTSSIPDGSLSTDVVNKKGANLPETGGMGTTIFYILGGIMMLGATVVLITRKRMESQQ
ncbi:MAG: isopeptide-forming domain-containing fimbrial protein [bacterium]|nr:isopeptide-forming domain-containing fimbrial protein [bacterium]